MVDEFDLIEPEAIDMPDDVPEDQAMAWFDNYVAARLRGLPESEARERAFLGLRAILEQIRHEQQNPYQEGA